MGKTRIEWSEKVWNPVTGCTKVSPGCQHCYAESMTRRLKGKGLPKYAAGFSKVVMHDDLLDEPNKWTKPSMVFVNSMSDIFHKDVSNDFILRVFDVMRKATNHTFQILTKRSARLAEMSPSLPWAANIWAGVSIENNDYLFRADDLRRTNAAIKFLSLEPLLGPLPNLNLVRIDWVIIGGESGKKARPMVEQWVTDIRDECAHREVPIFFKSWGCFQNNPDHDDPSARVNGGDCGAGRMLEGMEWSEMPSKDHY